MTDGVWGELRTGTDEEKMKKIRRSEKADYLVKINGSIEPVIYDGDFVSVKYAADIGNMCWGLYNFDGYASLAVKKDGKLYNLAGKIINTGLMSKPPVLYGKVIEFHKVSPLRSIK